MYKIINILLFCLLSARNGLAMKNEPRCYSQFDYDRKLLESAIQNDIQMKEIMKTFNSALQEIKEQKAELEEATSQLKGMIENTKENIATEVLEKVKSAGVAQQPIFFNAKKLEDLSPAIGSKLVYKEIDDNVGNAFDEDTGIFTAPVDGYYLFTVQISTLQNKWGNVKIIVNGEQAISVNNNNKAKSYTTTSGTTIQRLATGNQVWVKQEIYITGTAYCDGSNNGWNQFSGVLLHV